MIIFIGHQRIFDRFFFVPEISSAIRILIVGLSGRLFFKGCPDYPYEPVKMFLNLTNLGKFPPNVGTKEKLLGKDQCQFATWVTREVPIAANWDLDF